MNFKFNNLFDIIHSINMNIGTIEYMFLYNYVNDILNAC